MSIEQPPKANFSFKGLAFFCAAQATSAGLFVPVAIACVGPDAADLEKLPCDVAPYGTEAEAIRHAEQQAMHWAQYRVSVGSGQAPRQS